MFKKAISIFKYLLIIAITYYISTIFTINLYQLTHRFINNILFLFTLIFLFTPFFLAIITSKYKYLFITIIYLTTIYFLKNEIVIGTTYPKQLIIGYGLGDFSIFPLIGLYLTGYLLSKHITNQNKPSSIPTLSINTLFTTYYLLQKQHWHLTNNKTINFLVTINLICLLIQWLKIAYHYLPSNIIHSFKSRRRNNG